MKSMIILCKTFSAFLEEKRILFILNVKQTSGTLTQWDNEAWTSRKMCNRNDFNSYWLEPKKLEMILLVIWSVSLQNSKSCYTTVMTV